MGEDIHFRAYLKRRKDGRYVNAHEICEWDSSDSVFAEPFHGRNYDVFSLFGSSRGNYHILPSAKFGLPDFLVGQDLDDYCKECGFYGFVWFNVMDLERDLADFVEKLRDPVKYTDGDAGDCEWADLFAPGKKTKADMEKLRAVYREWQDEHGAMLHAACEILNRVQHFTASFCDRPENDQAKNPYQYYRFRDSPCSKLYDMNETVFLFFFDC